MAPDGSDNLRRQSSEDGGIQNACELRGKRRVRGLGDAGCELVRALLGTGECLPRVLSNDGWRSRVIDAENHARLDAACY
jgi:hypothetical protein